MSKPNQLFLLADHIKLSLLERQRAQTLDLESDSQDGHISRSLDQFREGLESLKEEETRLNAAGNQRFVHSARRAPADQPDADNYTAAPRPSPTPCRTWRSSTRI